MVAEGWAWAYTQYLDRPHASEYLQAEEQARAKRLGLWQQSNPKPPWEFRKALKRGKQDR
jgi:micrococcal nuclease